MVSKIQNKEARTYLDPSAGKGDIIEYLQEVYRYKTEKLDTIEIDETLQATLRGKNINVIDSDFLAFAGADKYDVIIMNPPFVNGHEHLLKAIEIMYCGEIICLLNAETLKNPHTHMGTRLIKKLAQLNANIEYIQDAFLDAERKTKVEIALVYIKIEKQVEDALFAGADNQATDTQENIETDNKVQTLNNIKNMVDAFNRVVRIGTETPVSYYQNYNHISKYIKITDDVTLTRIMQDKLNQFLQEVRKSYWTNVLQLDDVKKRLTSEKSDLFYHQLQKYAYMDFTEHNIRAFILNIINGYEQTLIDAVIKQFDDFTRNYAWDEDLHNGNVHYFNGWKTNKAFFVNSKVILPWYNFIDYGGEWKVRLEDEKKLRDIDLVMSYFDATNYYYSITNALNDGFLENQNRKILSTYFEISAFKKGTMHLTFRDEDIRRRFNITACKGKGWLPQDYGHKPYEQLPYEEQEIVKSFEDKKTYNENIGDCSFRITAPKNLLLT